MKALSIKEPYASLIAYGYKRIETRSYKTNYRGELYIHASLTNFNGDLSNTYKYINKDKYNNGYIICKCNLVDCIYMDQEYIDSVPLKEKELGIYEIGRYAWVLDNVELIDPIKAKGKLNIWEVNINEL